MASIEDFVNHRWYDAREELRRLDGAFVGKLENDVRLDRLGLTPPARADVIGTPKQRLPSQWHRLLEACFELTRQGDILKASVSCLTEDGSEGLSPIDIARQHDYHFRSWVIHAVALCDHADVVVDWSTKVYISDRTARRKVVDRHKKSVDSEIRNRADPNLPQHRHLNSLRNDYVHPARRSWSEAVTEHDCWEGCVALGITPRKHLEEFDYPSLANRVSPGIYSEAITETNRIFESLAQFYADSKRIFQRKQLVRLCEGNLPSPCELHAHATTRPHPKAPSPSMLQYTHNSQLRRWLLHPLEEAFIASPSP